MISPPSIAPTAIRKSRKRQRGSIVVNTAIALSLIVIALIGTELGYLFYMKREFQKTADLAALAGAMQLDPLLKEDEGCAKALAVAGTNATTNLSSIAIQTPECGRWAPEGGSTSDGHCLAGTEDHFIPGKRAYNAVRVRIRQEPPPLFALFSGQRTICVQAVATSSVPTAVFSVSSKLVDINAKDRPEAPLMTLLKFVGIDATGCVICSNGLVSATVRPGLLLKELGLPPTADLTVGGLNELLAARRVSLGQLLEATVTVAHQNGTLDASLDIAKLFDDLGIDVEKLMVQIGTDPRQVDGVRGLFAQIVTPDTQSALLAEVNALDLVTAAVGVALSTHAINLDVGSSLLGVRLRAKIVEPPSIGIGSPRSNGIAGAMAYNSQIRVHASVDTKDSILLGGILGALGTNITLPIALDVVNAHGELTDIDCSATPSTATIEVKSPILSACIGKIAEDALWSKTDVCTTTYLKPMPFVRLAGLDLLTGAVAIDALQHTQPLVLSPGETSSTTRNELKIGDTVKGVLDQLIPLLLGASRKPSDKAAVRAHPEDIATALAARYFERGSKDINKVRVLLGADGMTWSRPGGLLNLFSIPMEDEWKFHVDTGCRRGATYDACAQAELAKSLMTANQNGFLTDVIAGLVKIVSTLLGIDAEGRGTPLLSSLLAPLLDILKPLLNSIGDLVSSMLGSTLGLELGRTEVHLQSVSCKTSKLVY